MDISGILDLDRHENLCGSETLLCRCETLYVNYKKIVSADFEQGFFGVEEFYFLSVSTVIPSTQFHNLKIHPVFSTFYIAK